MISAGRVSVNGERAHIGQSILPGKDKITIDGKLIRLPHAKIYLALNKPRGYITSMGDDLGRRCVTELIKDVGSRVYPVGRLDRDSEGLLIMTDDGAFANAVAHPRHHIPKIYRVSIRPCANGRQLAMLENGVELDGKMTAPAKVVVISHEQDRAMLEITLFEGRNRQVRRMCEAVGLNVARLSRIGIGNLRLGGLRPGQWRELEPREISSLLRLAGVLKPAHRKLNSKGEFFD